uniref:Uncharacterized protein n=1 Tax=uncultured marine virus TaxID=186617 RepID=A0A0F7L8R7_9VIRU|nr:hypothetical protein [uncultured marine virus]
MFFVAIFFQRHSFVKGVVFADIIPHNKQYNIFPFQDIPVFPHVFIYSVEC